MLRVVLLLALFAACALAEGNNPKADGRHDNDKHHGWFKNQDADTASAKGSDQQKSDKNQDTASAKDQGKYDKSDNGNHFGWFKKLASVAPVLEPVEDVIEAVASVAPVKEVEGLLASISPLDINFDDSSEELENREHDIIKAVASIAPLGEIEGLLASIAPVGEVEGLLASISPLDINFDDSSEELENREHGNNGKSDNGNHYRWFKKFASAAPLAEPVEDVIEAVASAAPVKEVEGLLASIAPLNIFDDSSEEHDFLDSVLRAKRSDFDHEKPNGKSDNGNHFGWFKKLASVATVVEPVEEVIEAVASVAPLKEVEGLVASISPINLDFDSDEAEE